MRKLFKFLHSLASCGLIGGLVCYMIVLLTTPQATASTYADMRVTIAAISNYLLLPSLAVALVTGLMSMAVHSPFREFRWVWVKALLGLSMFEATLAIVQSKANYAASVAAKIAQGQARAEDLVVALTYEWYSLWAILGLSVANVVLGVWRPTLKRRRRNVAAS
ncbi:MAG: hypothetical protein AAGB04_05475 [Pseudomonadota bacterium]